MKKIALQAKTSVNIYVIEINGMSTYVRFHIGDYCN